MKAQNICKYEEILEDFFVNDSVIAAIVNQQFAYFYSKHKDEKFSINTKLIDLDFDEKQHMLDKYSDTARFSGTYFYTGVQYSSLELMEKLKDFKKLIIEFEILPESTTEYRNKVGNLTCGEFKCKDCPLSSMHCMGSSSDTLYEKLEKSRSFSNPELYSVIKERLDNDRYRII